MTATPPSQPELQAIQENAALWFVRLQDSETAGQWREEFTAWLQADPRHRAEYEAMQSLWSQAGQLRSQPAPKRHARTLLGGVAVALLVAGLLLNQREPAVSYQAEAARHLRLADGSELSMAPRTRLRFSTGWFSRRLQLEQGTIALSIAPEALRGFEVHAGGGIIRDIGTRFEVTAARDRVRVTVAEGRVEIELPAPSGPTHVQLGANETTDYGPTLLHPARPTDARQALAWTEGRLVFRDASLAQVVERLNPHLSLPIRLGSAQLAGQRLSGVFLLDDEAALLNALQAVVPLHFERGKDEYIARPGRLNGLP